MSNSQTRMNAGAEYVLYRIWATLQDREGIHAESLLSCVGALAGYACQAAAARAGADPGKYLLESPLCVLALTGRAVQKLGQPLPDIAGISAQTVALISDEHRPRLPAAVYVRQLWPQILPIARRFCRKPAELPVLFGIALQRAVEFTRERLSPTLAAGIAMESAVAMSKVAPLPEAPVDTVPSLWPTPEVAAAASKKTTLPLSEIRADLESSRTTRPASAKRKRRAVPSTPEVSRFAARLPSMKIAATIASLAIITLGVMWRTERGEAPEPTRVVRQLKVTSSSFQGNEPAPEQPIVETQAEQLPPPVIEELPPPPPPPPPEMESSMPTVPEPSSNEGIISSEERPPA